MNPPPLETLGRYKILDLLGRGAMGVVYKAIDPAIDRMVAIKTINLNMSADELAEYEARFAQEVKAAGRLNHPNIVAIYDVGKTDDFAWMAMEFVDGHELKALLRGGKPLPLADGLDLIQQVAEGLAFAHSKDVVHRDIKPSNIMITRDDEHAIAKITDFGIARMSSSAVRTMTGIVLGSPRYMSPEQVLGRKVGPPSDVFSLGVVLYETLTGAAPFDSPSINSIMYQTVHEACQPPSTLNSALAPELDMLVNKALAKAPEERFASMRDFARAIREVRQALGSAPDSRARASLLSTIGPLPAPKAPAGNLLDGLQPGPPLDPAELTRVAERATPRHAGGTLPPVAAARPGEATDPGATNRRLSRDFDSTSATRRLAALTEQLKEVESILETPPPGAPPAASEPAGNIAAAAPRNAIELDATRIHVGAPRPFPIGAAALLCALAALNLGLLVALAL
jgi:serine/threonine-protein kinase